MSAERLQKILSRAGLASRRAAEQAMAEGRVTVNGEPVTKPGSQADAAVDDIRLDGQRVQASPDRVYLLLFKPRGYVSTRSDPQGRPTVMELVPKIRGLFPVGRLDYHSEGLLIMSNDGDFAQRVAHPSFEIARVYHAKVRGLPDADALSKLVSGVHHDGERLAADAVRILKATPNAWIELRVHQGRKHEVRRLLEAVGHPVSKLRRIALGPLTTRGLALGQFRVLHPAEIAQLLGAKPREPRRPQRQVSKADGGRAGAAVRRADRPAGRKTSDRPTGRKTADRPAGRKTTDRPTGRKTAARPAGRKTAAGRGPGRPGARRPRRTERS